MVSARISRAAVCAALFIASVPASRAELISEPAWICGSGAGASLGSPGAISRWIAFLSSASDLVAGQSGPEGWGNVFLYDRTTQAVTLASHVAGSPQATDERSSGKLSLSADGRWIAFESASESLSGEDCNGRSDVFLYDRDGALQIVSRRHPDLPALTGSWASLLANHAYPVSALSDDGRFVAFAGGATNLVGGVTGYNSANVFLRDRQTGETVLVSATAAGKPANHDSLDLALSADGRWVAFLSKATDLVPGQVDAEASNDVFLFDRVSRNVTLVSRSADSAVTAGNSASVSLGLSSDGRYVVFSSRATNLVPGQVDTFATEDVFVYDRLTGQTGLVSRKAGTLVEAAGSSGEPQISGDGLVPGQTDTNADSDIFLHDRRSGENTLVSHAAGSPATAGAGLSRRAPVSADGKVAFLSRAPDLVAGQVDDTRLSDGGTVHVVIDVTGYFE